MVVCLAWAFNFVAASKGVEVFSPPLLMVLRFLLVFALTWPFLRKPAKGSWPHLIGACFLMGAVHFTIMFWALQKSSDVTSVVILQHMYIPMSVILAILLLKEIAGWRTLASVALATLGVLVIGFDPLVLGQLDALGLSMCSAFAQALGSVAMRGVKGISVMGFQAWSAVFSIPVLIVVTWIWGTDVQAQLAAAETIHWVAVVYSAIVASIVGHGLFFYLVQRNPLPEVMPYMLMTPVFGAFFGIVIWGDRPGWRLFLGGTLVLTGILFVTLRSRSKAMAGVRHMGSNDQ